MVLSSCVFLRPTPTPMKTRFFHHQGTDKAAGVILLFPGLSDSVAGFERQGFVERLRRYAPEHDLLGVDAHFGYYRKGLLLERLESDVVRLLVESGYRETWLVGISMGGLGALAFARLYPKGVSGVMLFAPYLGSGPPLEEIVRAGDLCLWKETSEPEGESDEDRFYRDNWRFLRSRFCDEPATGRNPGPEIWFGYGDADRPVTAGLLLLEKLGEEHIGTVGGGHGWAAWRPLLDELGPRAFAN